MAVLPQQGGSEGTWGTELNTWLQVEHSATANHDSAAFFDTVGDHLVMFDDDIITNKNELVYI